MNKFAFFDVDSTLIANFSSTLSFNEFLVRKGIAPAQIGEDCERLIDDYRSKRIDYTEATRRVVEIQAHALSGLNKEEVASLGDEFAKEEIKPFPFVQELFALLQHNSFQIYLISGGGYASISAIARFLDVANFCASELEIENGKYTGKYINVLNNTEKKHAIQKILAESGESHYSLVFGDSTGDADMLMQADQGFIINSHQEEMLELAKEHNWILVSNENIVEEVNKVIASLA